MAKKSKPKPRKTSKPKAAKKPVKAAGRLRADRTVGGGIDVLDENGRRWRPNGDACEEIERDRDPEARAVKICKTQPSRGGWL